MSTEQTVDAQPPVRVLGIAGSLRANSYNRRLLQLAAEQAPHAVQLTIWGGLKAIPPFDEDDEPTPPAAVLELREAIAASDALLLVTPEYNGSLPGQLKNALDWASRPRARPVLRDTPAAVIGASPSPSGARNAQSDARRVLARAGARVIDCELAVASVHTRLATTDRLGDDDLDVAVQNVLIELLRAVQPAARVTARA